MSSSLSSENINSIPGPSVLMRCEQQTTYKFYESKFHNLIKHVEHIASYEATMQPFSERMRMINFDIFLQINEREKTELTVDEKMAETAEAENFDLSRIKPDDLHKLKRYYELFQTLND